MHTHYIKISVEAYKGAVDHAAAVDAITIPVSGHAVPHGAGVTAYVSIWDAVAIGIDYPRIYTR